MTATPERERMIRAAWDERGSKQWDPVVHGRGLASLTIQTSDLRSVPFEQPLLPYDDLEFRLVSATMRGRAVNSVVCEGVVVATLPT